MPQRLRCGGRGQGIGLAVRRLQRKMMMSMPATACQPQPERIVFGRIPLEFKAVTGFGIVDAARPSLNRPGKKLLRNLPSGMAEFNGINPRRAIQQARASRPAIRADHPLASRSSGCIAHR